MERGKSEALSWDFVAVSVNVIVGIREASGRACL